LEHLPLLLLQLAGVVAAAQQQHEVVLPAQALRAAKHLHQRRNVLAVIGPADGEDRRFGRIAQKRP